MSSSRPDSTVLHHAIATGDIETVKNLLNQGIVNVDERLQIDDDILETASRKSFTSLHSFRQQSTVTDAIMEDLNERDSINSDENETAGIENTIGDNETETIKTVGEQQQQEGGEMNSEIKNTQEENEDIDQIMKECQHEVEEEHEKHETAVIKVPQTDEQLDDGESKNEAEQDVKPAFQRLKTEDEQQQSSSSLKNNNNYCGGSLADTIDLRLRDDNEGLLERTASVRTKDITEVDEDTDVDNKSAPKKLIPRIKRKISLKFTKRPKKDILEEDDEECDDLTYVNLVKTRNVDDEQLEENFEGVAFFEAVRDGMDMIVQTLLETSNNYQLNMLDENGFTPAMQAAWHGQAECLEILIRHGANIDLRNATGCTAAHFAAGQGHTECLQLLISDDTEQVDAKTKYGATPLILAAKGGYKDCMDILLEAGAEANTQYRGSQNALLFAAGNGHYECIQTLLEHNVDLNQSNSQRVTPLMRAVQQGHNACVALLVDKGADLNLQDAIGRTAVHFAVEHNNPKGLKFLLQTNTNLELKTKGGSRPLDYAGRFQNTRCGEIIENHINKLREEREKERDFETQRQTVQEKERHVSCISFKHIFRRRSRKNNENV